MSSSGVIWLNFPYNTEIIFTPLLKDGIPTTGRIPPSEGYVLDEVAISMVPASCMLLLI